METRKRSEEPEHVSICIPQPNSNSQPFTAHPLSPPPPTITPLPHPSTSPHPHHTPHAMHSEPFYSASAYPREADTDSETEDSILQMDEEDPLYPLNTSQTHPSPSYTPPHRPPSHISPFSPFAPPSSSSSSSPQMEPTLRHQSSISEDLLCTICTAILHDPMSLHCGHSFCQLCLAAMWKNSREPASAVDLKCPVCRASWRNFPGVNIQLRNIIERTYPQRCAGRGSTMPPEDEELLLRFKQARERESQLKDKVGPQLRRDEIRRLVSALCCIFTVIVALLVLMFSLMFWAWAGAGGEFMRKPASQWSQEDVAEWMAGLGNWATSNYSQLFLGEHITGQRLLQLDEAALKAIGIKNEYRRQSILYSIHELRAAEYSTPRNFNEFKAAHRRQTLVILMFYSLWPRLTLLYVYSFNYYEMFLPFLRYHFPSHEKLAVESHIEEGAPHGGNSRGSDGSEAQSSEALPEPSSRELVAIFVEILLIPHFLVAYFAWGWAGQHPWIAYPVIVHCVWCMWGEGKQVVGWVRSGSWETWRVTNWRVKIPQLCRALFQMVVKQYFFFIFLFFIVTMLWHVTPHFLCDLLFYYLIWQSVLYLVCMAPLISYLRAVGAGNNFQLRMNFNGRQVAGQ